VGSTFFLLKHIILLDALIIICRGGIFMISIFIYFLIFLIPGLFAVLIYNLISDSSMGCCRTITSALIFDLLILGINLAGLRFLKCICTFQELQSYFCCLSFTPKYILLSLIIGIVLAVLAYLLLHLYCWCKRRFCHGRKKECNR